jgi:predicted nucleic acid-binding Zn ribbon protein
MSNPDQPWTRYRRPKQLSELIGRMRAQLVPPTLLAAVQERWAAAVGARVSEQASPVSEREGVVTVSCRSATWTTELSLLSRDLLERLNAELGEGPRVAALRFVTRGS